MLLSAHTRVTHAGTYIDIINIYQVINKHTSKLYSTHAHTKADFNILIDIRPIIITQRY